MRIYISNDSYPELREAPRGWPRHLIWWRAIWSARSDWRFWICMGACWLIGGLAALVAILIRPLDGVASGRGRVDGSDFAAFSLFGLGVVGASVLLLTWGGEIMRPHLRKASPICRCACRVCGHLLSDPQAREDSAGERRWCSECGEQVR